MSRRATILALALGSLILAGLGLRDWTIDPARASVYAGRTLSGYGIAQTEDGPASYRLLPLPRLTLHRVRLATSSTEGALNADGGRLGAGRIERGAAHASNSDPCRLAGSSCRGAGFWADNCWADGC